MRSRCACVPWSLAQESSSTASLAVVSGVSTVDVHFTVLYVKDAIYMDCTCVRM